MSMSSIDSQESAYREEHEIDVLTKRIAELEEQRDVLLRCMENDYGIKASWDGLRKLWLTESATSELDYVEDKSRWAELFGTPERAARTLASIVTADGCEDCALLDATCSRHEDVWLEWLRGDAE